MLGSHVITTSFAFMLFNGLNKILACIKPVLSSNEEIPDFLQKGSVLADNTDRSPLNFSSMPEQIIFLVSLTA